MRAPAWGGATPASDSEARKRLLGAARICIERFGLEKTCLSDVAAEAGVTRQTVYRFFDSSDQLMRAAFALAAGGIVDRMVRHARTFENPGERIIEAMLFLCREIPVDPYLGPPFLPARNGTTGRNVSSAVAAEVSRDALRAVAETGPNGPCLRLSEEELDDLIEVILRLLQSLLTNPGPRTRSEEQLRTLLRRWLLPAMSSRGHSQEVRQRGESR